VLEILQSQEKHEVGSHAIDLPTIETKPTCFEQKTSIASHLECIYIVGNVFGQHASRFEEKQLSCGHGCGVLSTCANKACFPLKTTAFSEILRAAQVEFCVLRDLPFESEMFLALQSKVV
jgi:hypothetical protein